MHRPTPPTIAELHAEGVVGAWIDLVHARGNDRASWALRRRFRRQSRLLAFVVKLFQFLFGQVTPDQRLVKLPGRRFVQALGERESRLCLLGHVHQGSCSGRRAAALA